MNDKNYSRMVKKMFGAVKHWQKDSTVHTIENAVYDIMKWSAENPFKVFNEFNIEE